MSICFFHLVFAMYFFCWCLSLRNCSKIRDIFCVLWTFYLSLREQNSSWTTNCSLCSRDTAAFVKCFWERLNKGVVKSVGVVFIIFTCFVLSAESLISAIHGDIEEAKKRLDLPEHLKLKEDNFFQVPKSKIRNGHWGKVVFLLIYCFPVFYCS